MIQTVIHSAFIRACDAPGWHNLGCCRWREGAGGVGVLKMNQMRHLHSRCSSSRGDRQSRNHNSVKCHGESYGWKRRSSKEGILLHLGGARDNSQIR